MITYEKSFSQKIQTLVCSILAILGLGLMARPGLCEPPDTGVQGDTSGSTEGGHFKEGGIIVRKAGKNDKQTNPNPLKSTDGKVGTEKMVNFEEGDPDQPITVRGSTAKVKLNGSSAVPGKSKVTGNQNLNSSSRLMEEEGISYYFKHTDGGHKVILGKGTAENKTLKGLLGAPGKNMKTVKTLPKLKVPASSSVTAPVKGGQFPGGMAHPGSSVGAGGGNLPAVR